MLISRYTLGNNLRAAADAYTADAYALDKANDPRTAATMRDQARKARKLAQHLEGGGTLELED